MKKFNLMFLALISIIIISCGESAEEYNKRALTFADSAISNSDLNYTIISTRQETWREAIYDNEYKNPLTGEYKMAIGYTTIKATVKMDEALNLFDVDMAEIYTKIDKKKKQLDSLYGTIKEPPTKSEKIFQIIKDLYSNYLRSYELAKAPGANSYQDYNEVSNKLFDEYKKLKSDLEIEKR